MKPNYITEWELNAVKGLLHYLNKNTPDELSVEVVLIDCNGEPIGKLTQEGSDGKYVLEFPS